MDFILLHTNFSCDTVTKTEQSSLFVNISSFSLKKKNSVMIEFLMTKKRSLVFIPEVLSTGLKRSVLPKFSFDLRRVGWVFREPEGGPFDTS